METRTGINCLILATTNLSVYLCTMVNMNVTVILEFQGLNPGKQTVYHMCKTWLQKVHSGWDTGGDIEIKIYK